MKIFTKSEKKACHCGASSGNLAEPKKQEEQPQGKHTDMKKALLTLAIVTVAAVAARADIVDAWDVSGHGSPADATLTASTINPALNTGATLNTLSRTGVTAASAGNSFSSTGWNTGAFDQTVKFDTFTISPNSNITLTDLQFAMNGSNTAPNQGLWGYSIDGGSFVFGTAGDGGAFTLTNPAPAGLATWNFGDFSVTSSDTVEFRFWAFGSTAINSTAAAASTGTVRIANFSGNDLVLNGTAAAIPEPATVGLIGLGLAGVVAFARRRSSK